METRLLRAAVLFAALLVVAAGCWNPTGEAPKAGTEAGSAEHGLVVLQFHDLRSLTITPEISLEIESYEVSFTRSGFQPVTVFGVPGDATQSDPVSLLPGPWQVTVSAFNDDSPAKVIGFGEREVSVSPRQTTTTAISIRSLTGEGVLSLTADISALELLSPSISGTLSSGATGEEIAVSMSIDGSSGSFEENLEAGTYLLSLQLFENETPIAGFVNAVLIVYGETTRATLVFREVGGIIRVSLEDEITRPIAITLEGLQETLSPEDSMTVIAHTATAVDSYQWYLNGYAIPGEDQQEITLGPGLAEGEYVLTVVVQRGEIQSAEAGEFTVITMVPEPAGGRIAFSSTHDGSRAIWVMNPDGSELANISGPSARADERPAWSPDGSRIAFHSTRGGEQYPNIWVMNADGTEPVNLTNSYPYDGYPTWSPDGSRIAFESRRRGMVHDIWVMDADGSNLVNLTEHHPPAGTHASAQRAPAWSPDGTLIAFDSSAGGGVDIWVMKPDGTEPLNLTNSSGVDRNPAWSPDGSRIAFSSTRDGPLDIWAMNADGSDPVNLTSHSASDRHPAWSPDGTQIAFSSHRNWKTNIWVMNAEDGTDLVSPTGDRPQNHNNQYPAWW